MKKSRITRVAGKPGDSIARPSLPVLSLLHDGARSYLWIGNDVQGDMYCYATVSGPATLRKLAKAILAEVGDAR